MDSKNGLIFFASYLIVIISMAGCMQCAYCIIARLIWGQFNQFTVSLAMIIITVLVFQIINHHH